MRKAAKTTAKGATKSQPQRCRRRSIAPMPPRRGRTILAADAAVEADPVVSAMMLLSSRGDHRGGDCAAPVMEDVRGDVAAAPAGYFEVKPCSVAYFSRRAWRSSSASSAVFSPWTIAYCCSVNWSNA